MGTDKNKISAYLTDSEFQTLKTLAAKYEVSKSQAVIMAIKALAGQSVNIPSGVTAAPNVELLGKDEVNQAIAAALAPIVEDVESLKKRLETLTALPEPSPSEPLELENLPLLEALQKPEPSEPMELMERMESLETETAIAPAPSEDKPDFSQGLYGKELAARLGVSNSGLSRAFKPEKDKPERPEYFKEWSQEKDPDGLAWEKRNDEKFYPVG